MKRRARARQLVALSVAAATAAAAQAPPSPAFDELMRLLASHQHGHASFTEVQHLAMLERPLESSGELLYEAPDHLEKRTLKPRSESLVLEHGVLTAHRGHHSYAASLQDYPQLAPFIESVRATLAGDRAALERLFRVEFDGDLAHWTLQLVPADATLATVVHDIRITGERDVIHTVEIHMSDGDRSLLTLAPPPP